MTNDNCRLEQCGRASFRCRDANLLPTTSTTSFTYSSNRCACNSSSECSDRHHKTHRRPSSQNNSRCSSSHTYTCNPCTNKGRLEICNPTCLSCQKHLWHFLWARLLWIPTYRRQVRREERGDGLGSCCLVLLSADRR